MVFLMSVGDTSPINGAGLGLGISKLIPGMYPGTEGTI